MWIPEISVIIPVYNTEKYVCQCVESVIRSTVFPQCEVILIDDGSADTSVALLGRYAEKYDSIRLYSYSNGGLSRARNRGLEQSAGRYIFFLDSDDFLERDYLEKLYKTAIENSCDIIFAGFRYTEDQTDVCRITDTDGCPGNVQREPCAGKLRREVLELGRAMSGCEYLEERMRLGDWENQVCPALYRSAFLKEQELHFEADIRIYEDILFTGRALCQAERVFMIPEYGYCYRIRENSLVHKGVVAEAQDVESLLLILERLLQLCRDGNTKQRHAAGRMCFELISMILYYIGKMRDAGQIGKTEQSRWFQALSRLEPWEFLWKSAATGKEKLKWILWRMNWGSYYPLVRK